MTSNEARDILVKYNQWRRGESYDIPQTAKIGIAIDAAIVALSNSENLDLTIAYQSGYFDAYQSGYFDGKRSKSDIAQSIRNAAINWPQFLGNVECEIISAFCDAASCVWIDSLYYAIEGEWPLDQARIFMLLVAEALE